MYRSIVLFHRGGIYNTIYFLNAPKVIDLSQLQNFTVIRYIGVPILWRCGSG